MTGEATHGMKLVAGAKVTKSAAYLTMLTKSTELRGMERYLNLDSELTNKFATH